MSAKGHQTEKGPISKKELLSRIAAGEDGIVVPSLANQDWAAFQQDSLRDPTLINFLSCVLVPILTWLYPDITASELREAQLLGSAYGRPRKRLRIVAAYRLPPVRMADTMTRRAQPSTSKANANESIDVEMAGLSTVDSNGDAGNSHATRHTEALSVLPDVLPPTVQELDDPMEIFRKTTPPVNVNHRTSKKAQPTHPPLQSSSDVASTSITALSQPSVAEDTGRIAISFPSKDLDASHIYSKDLRRLTPGEFLNDELIELGLKFARSDLQIRRPGALDRIHFFNTFFYTKVDQEDLQKGYDLVKKWTNGVDIFEKRFIIIPVHERFRVAAYTGISPSYAIRVESSNDLVNSTGRRSARIYIIDSLNHPRDRAKAVLTSYLAKEAVHRGKLKSEKDAVEPSFIRAKAPEQTNYCDCGVYLIHFAKVFINHPDRTERVMKAVTDIREAKQHRHWRVGKIQELRDGLLRRIQELSETRLSEQGAL
ncbi:cysteine proteinase [Stereum hirsutum FP-91666 SS1]|uniref:cysteine proteinase n=1 Tax=Stereum hirsutum (strain FP-91666) TaxID=721885 RepID=UPI000444A0C8|nr:cysteine proteinase [Stereum hirsutum FP-91666 SS1]EIM83607.1 cysteine proteinase [Stereum hirsutum FP-91666 SS1]